MSPGVLWVLGTLSPGMAVLVTAPPQGHYCGVLHTISGVDVGVRLEIEDGHADVTAEAFGMDTTCRGVRISFDPETGALDHRQPGRRSCIEEELANYNQDASLVRASKDPGSDAILVALPGERRARLTPESCAAGRPRASRRLEGAMTAFKPGNYCGTVRTEDQADVGVRFKIISESRVEITARVFGLDLFCEESYRMDASTGEMAYENVKVANSCVRKQFRNFNQDPDGVSVNRVAEPDVLRLHTSMGTTVLVPAKCTTEMDTRRLATSPVLL